MDLVDTRESKNAWLKRVGLVISERARGGEVNEKLAGRRDICFAGRGKRSRAAGLFVSEAAAQANTPSWSGTGGAGGIPFHAFGLSLLALLLLLYCYDACVRVCVSRIFRRAMPSAT